MSDGLLGRMARSWRAVAWLWFAGVVASWTLARPIAQTLTTTGVHALPEGDAALFAPGGHYLLEAIARSRDTLEPLLLGSLWELTLVFGALLLPLAFAVHELRALVAPRPERLAGASLVARATTSWPRFALLGTVTLLAQGACFGLALLVLLPFTPSLQRSFGAEHGAWLAIAVALPVCLPAWAAGILRDVARARSTGHAESAGANVKVAIEIVRLHWVRCTMTSFGVACGSALLVAVAAYLTTRFDVSRPGQWRIAGVAFVHQLALLGIATLRVSWIRECVRLASEPSPLERAALGAQTPAARR